MPSQGLSAPPAARPATTIATTRGVCRLLLAREIVPLLEVPLADGRRADVLGIGPDGKVWIVEVKSSIEDFRADAKWTDYLQWCDQFLFGVPPEFPLDLAPVECGLIVADAFGGEILREDARPAETARLAAARRKALTLRAARLAARRLRRIDDPSADP